MLWNHFAFEDNVEVANTITKLYKSDLIKNLQKVYTVNFGANTFFEELFKFHKLSELKYKQD